MMERKSGKWLKEHNVTIDVWRLSPTRTNIYLSREISEKEAGEYLKLEGHICATAPVGFFDVRYDYEKKKYFIYVDDSTD